MKLFIDIGNSEAKWATGEELARELVQRTDSGELAAALIPRLAVLAAPSQVHIASVLRPDRLAPLQTWIEQNWGLRPQLAQTRAAELGVVNGYRPPQSLGVDRWLGLLAARALSQAPQLVVDCGTATTMDALDAHGRHLGGVILPGLRLFHHCLGSSTDIPPTDTSSTEIGEFATDTAAGIASGAMLATTSAVEAMMTRMRQLGGDVQCLLTGGMAPQVARYLKTPHRLVPHLILQGLSLQAEQQERP